LKKIHGSTMLAYMWEAKNPPKVEGRKKRFVKVFKHACMCTPTPTATPDQGNEWKVIFQVQCIWIPPSLTVPTISKFNEGHISLDRYAFEKWQSWELFWDSGGIWKPLEGGPGIRERHWLRGDVTVGIAEPWILFPRFRPDFRCKMCLFFVSWCFHFFDHLCILWSAVWCFLSSNTCVCIEIF